MRSFAPRLHDRPSTRRRSAFNRSSTRRTGCSSSSMTRSRLSAATFPAPVLRPGDVVEIECTDLIAKTGQAVGRADGMVVYVLGPVPGERARVRIEVVKAKYAVGELLEFLARSPDRVEPFCAVFGTCGGCQVQHLAYPAQLVWKKGL